ncbi:outer dense fiber protein 4-like protein [Camelus ferus]|nr:outer dense fiber protein 4-like protein [Camelus ferus]
MSIRRLEMAGRAGKQDGVEVSLEQDEGVQNCVSAPASNRQLPVDQHVQRRRVSPLPLQWRITHSSRWIAQMLASELSLIAFILLLVMVFSKNWLYLSKCRFYQRWPTNVTTRIYTTAHIMSMGLLQICKSKSCSNSEEWERITFCLALGLGLVLTVWLHLPYIPGFQRLPFFGWIGTVVNFCEVFLIFFTLILFPINVWLFELKKNLSIPIGWSYFIGWLVFFLYVTCAALCYFNHKRFWSLILSHPSGTVSSSSNCRLIRDSLNGQTVSNTTVNQAEVLDPE